MLKAPLTGSSWKGVPGTLVPLGTTVPSTIGPRSLVHSLKRRPSRPQPRVSRKTHRAVSNCCLLRRARSAASRGSQAFCGVGFFSLGREAIHSRKKRAARASAPPPKKKKGTYSEFRVDGGVVDVVRNVVDLGIVRLGAGGRGDVSRLEGSHGGKAVAVGRSRGSARSVLSEGHSRSLRCWAEGCGSRGQLQGGGSGSGAQRSRSRADASVDSRHLHLM